MKKNKSTNTTIKSDEKQPIVLIGNTYRKSPNPIIIFIIRILLTYLISVGTLMCFVKYYNIPYELSMIIQQVLLFVTAFFPVFVIIRKRIIIPVLCLSSAILYYFLNEVINDALILFKDHLLINIDSRLLQTIQYVPKNSLAFLTRTQDYLSGMNLFMLIGSLVICICCVIFSYKKLNIIGFSAMWAILYVPAFIAEIAEICAGVIIIVTAFAGLVTISSSNSYFSLPIKSADSQLSTKQKKKQSAIRKATSDLLLYGKNSVCGVIAAAIALGTIYTASLAFPLGKSLDTDEIIDNVGNFFTDLGSAFSSTFGGAGNSFNNYFSSDNFFISNDIELNAPPSDTGEKILSVTSSNGNPIFLVGDIGVDYTGNSWKSIMSKVDKNRLYTGNYNISDSFRPETILQVYLANTLMTRNNTVNTSEMLIPVGEALFHVSDYNYLLKNRPYYLESFSDIDKIISNLSEYDSISVSYNKNTDIVFKPFMPDSASYSNNDKFITYGDSIIRLADKKNWIDSFSSNVIIPNFSMWYSTASHELINYDNLNSTLVAMGMNSDEARTYLSDKSEYDRYVKDMYTSVPESEKENINKFLNEFEEYGNTIKVKDIENKYLYVYELCKYLQTNYQYSLTADNRSGNNTLLGNFLFDTKSGHCAMYASSMVLALREKGIPARYITGFSIGKFDYNSMDMTYSKDVYAKDLHAWVEVYFEDIGWMPFDPTGGWNDSGQADDNPVFTDSQSSSNTVQTPPPVTTTTTTTHSSPDSQVTTPPQTTAPPVNPDSDNNSGDTDISDKQDFTVPAIILIVVVVLIAIALGVYSLYSYTIRKIRKRTTMFRSGECTKSVKAMHDFIIKLFDTTDIKPLKNELPTEFAERTDKMMKISDKKNNLLEVMHIIEKAEFSDGQVTEDERQIVFAYTNMLYNLVMNNSGKIKQVYLKITL